MIKNNPLSLWDLDLDENTSPAGKISKIDQGQSQDFDYSRGSDLVRGPIIGPDETWKLGRHVLYCGDWKDFIKNNLVPVDAVITDPPFGISHKTDYTRLQLKNSKGNKWTDRKKIHGDNQPFDPKPLLDLKVETYILCGYNCFSDKLPVGSCLVWDKRYQGKDKLLSDGEVAWLNKGHGTYIFNHYWNGFLRQSEGTRSLHPTQKPVALFDWFFNWAPAGGIVFDPFSGSGPCLLAAELTNRKCLACEIDPDYAGLIIQRWQDLTGQTAEKIA